MKSLYQMLKETEELNTFRNNVRNNFKVIFRQIDEYIYIGENKKEILDSLSENLNQIIEEFKQIGIFYEPDASSDVSESTFKTILERYKNSSEDNLNDLSSEILEEFNVQTQYILNLIDVHRASLIDEGEILYEE